MREAVPREVALFTDGRYDQRHEKGSQTAPGGNYDMRQVCGFSLERIRNAVEVLACRMLEQKLERCPEIDKTKDLIEDIYCLALNRVPALYYHSASSFAQRLEDQGPPTDLLQSLDEALDHAIIKVMQNPKRG